MLARKPEALRNGAPFTAWALPGALGRVQQKLHGSAEGDREVVRAVRGALAAPFATGRQAIFAHQASHALAANPAAMGAKFGMHARAAVAAAVGFVGGADFAAEHPVRCRMGTLRPVDPVVVAAPAHPQHFAHDADRKLGDVVTHERIAHLRPGAWPKMSAAFFKMSRSIRTRSSSRRNRPISAA